MIFGVALCFFGGTYVAAIAAAEAWRHMGWQRSYAEAKFVWDETQRVRQTSIEDDKVDADKNGIADVDELTPQQLAQVAARACTRHRAQALDEQSSACHNTPVTSTSAYVSALPHVSVSALPHVSVLSPHAAAAQGGARDDDGLRPRQARRLDRLPVGGLPRRPRDPPARVRARRRARARHRRDGQVPDRARRRAAARRRARPGAQALGADHHHDRHQLPR